MRQGSRGLHAMKGAAAWLLALGCALGAAQAQTPAAPEWVVGPGQSATELALDQVPPGTTIDQFLLAIYQLNPQAFAGGDLHRLLAQARLRLPTAEEANRVPLAQARERLSRLHAGLPPQALPAPSLQPAPAEAAPVQAPPAAAPVTPPPVAPAPADTRWTAWVAALVAVGGLLFWRRMRQAAPATAVQATAADLEAQAQGRFQPVLPADAPASPRTPGTHANPAASAEGMAPQENAPSSSVRAQPPGRSLADTPPAPKPALFDLDLNLDGQAPPLDLKLPATGAKPALAGLGLPSLDLGGGPAPRHAPGPLDLGGLSLDLEPAPTGKGSRS